MDKIDKLSLKATLFLRFVKFEHTIFALPFALSSYLLAIREVGFSKRTLFWIILCMIFARNAAMGFNRIADAKIDAKNPRTKAREIPSGLIKVWEAYIFVGLSSLLFIFSSYMLNKICFYLSPLALFLLFTYSFTKRFTYLSHFILGACDALAPSGAWIATGARFSFVPFLLSLFIFFWVSGFDLIYACQDEEFDKSFGLFSIPACFGKEKALNLSSVLHLFSVISLLLLYKVASLGYLYLFGVLLISFLLFFEHKIVKGCDLSRINIAFFKVNSAISIIFLFSIFFDLITKSLIKTYFAF